MALDVLALATRFGQLPSVMGREPATTLRWLAMEMEATDGE